MRRLPRPPARTDRPTTTTTIVLSVWQYLGSGYLNPATYSWQPASKHPYEPPAKPCTICVADHRNDEFGAASVSVRRDCFADQQLREL
jgi:hypothetical protein